MTNNRKFKSKSQLKKESRRPNSELYYDVCQYSGCSEEQWRFMQVESIDRKSGDVYKEWAWISLNTGRTSCCVCRRRLPLLNPSPRNTPSDILKILFKRRSGFPYTTLTSIAAAARNLANGIIRAPSFRPTTKSISPSKQTKLKKLQSLDALLSE